MALLPSLALLTVLASCSGAPAETEPAAPADIEAPLPDGTSRLVARGDELTWGPCPPNLPAGCTLAVLEGDPRESRLFTLRIRTDRPFVLPAHSHPANERVTVIEGTIHVGFGTEVDKAASERFVAGDYYVNGRGEVHFVWSDEPVVVQITGIGPWRADPVTR